MSWRGADAMNGLINMVIRLVMRQVINLGISKGVDAWAKRQGREDATPEQKAQTTENKKRAKQAIRVTRRIGRF